MTPTPSIPTTLTEITRFLALNNIAIVGVSRTGKGFAANVFADFKKRGYAVTAVNTKAALGDAELCASIAAVAPHPDGVVLIVPSTAIRGAVDDCIAAGIHSIWIYAMSGKLDTAVLEHCKEHGVTTISGHCPLMFLSNPVFFHRMHRFGLKLAGKYPKP